MARYKQSEILANIKDYFAIKLPPKLTAAGLLAFEDYLDRPPTSDEKRQFAVYLAEGADAVNDKRDSVLIRAQLYRQPDPVPYLDAIWELVEDYSPECLGYNTKNMTWLTWYAGEEGNAYGGSQVVIELQLSKENDDCYLDDQIC